MSIPPDLQRFTPPASENLLAATGDDADASKDVKVYEKTITGFKRAWPELRDGLAEKARTLKERGWSGQELHSELADSASEVVGAALEKAGHRRGYIERRQNEAAEALTDYDRAERLPEESEFRDYLRSLDGQERLQVLREVAENGSSMARRAVARSWIPPRMAGLQDDEHRQRLVERMHRAEDPDAFETSRALGKGLEAMDRTADAFRQQASALVDYLASDG